MSKLGDFCINITDGEHGTVKDIQDIQDRRYYLLSNKNIINSKIQIDGSDRTISKADYEKINKRTKLEHEDVVIATVGTIGKTAILDRPSNYVFQRSVGIIKTNKEKLNPYYLKYQIDTPNFQKRLQLLSKGGVQKCIFINDLKGLDVKIPPIKEQEEIISILKNIDSKIENNNAIIIELESLAKDIYNYWFTQFDFSDENGKPYKSSGGKMVWNKELKREIPEGWKLKPLFDIMDVVYGFPLSTECFDDKNGIPVIRIRDILDNTFSAYTTENVPDYALSRNKDLLIGMDGNFHMNFCANDDYVINQRITRIRNKSNTSVLQVYFEIMPYIKAKEQNVARSTVGHLSDKDLKGLRILDTCNTNIYNFFESILDTYCLFINENIELTSLRDFLLPLLMNGQVIVGGADE